MLFFCTTYSQIMRPPVFSFQLYGMQKLPEIHWQAKSGKCGCVNTKPGSPGPGSSSVVWRNGGHSGLAVLASGQGLLPGQSPWSLPYLIDQRRQWQLVLDGETELGWPAALGQSPSRGQLCGDPATGRAGQGWTCAPSSCLSEVPALWPHMCTSC